MLLYVCPDCGGHHIFASLEEMQKLSGRLGIVLCVNGCGIMLQVLPQDKLSVRFAPVKVEQSK